MVIGYPADPIDQPGEFSAALLLALPALRISIPGKAGSLQSGDRRGYILRPDNFTDQADPRRPTVDNPGNIMLLNAADGDER